MDPDSADVLFLDNVVLPVVMQDLFSGLDVLKTVDVPQLQFLTLMVGMPVEIPQAQFSDKVYMPVVVSGPDGQTAQKTVEIPQAQFSDKVYMPVVVSGADGQTAQKTVEDPQLQFLDKVLPARCCACQGYGPDSAARELHVQFLDKVDTPVVVHRQVPGSAGSFSALELSQV